MNVKKYLPFWLNKLDRKYPIIWRSIELLELRRNLEAVESLDQRVNSMIEH